MSKKKKIEVEERVLPEDLVNAANALKSMATDHVQKGLQQIDQAQSIVNALYLTISTLDGKLKDASFVAPEGFTFVDTMKNFRSIVEGAAVNRATHDALQDMWLRVSKEVLTEEEFEEHFLNKADAAE